MKKVIDGDWSAGHLYFKLPNVKRMRLIERNPYGKICKATSGAQDALKEFNFGDLIQRMNNGERM